MIPLARYSFCRHYSDDDDDGGGGGGGDDELSLN